MLKNALCVFDNMGRYGSLPSLWSCNSLLSSLVIRGQCMLDDAEKVLREMDKSEP